MNLGKWIDQYIEEMKTARTHYLLTKQDTQIYKVITKAIKVIGEKINIKNTDFSWNGFNAEEDAEIFIDLLMYYKENMELKEQMHENKELSQPLIFLSHKSDDKKYGHALRDFIVGLGVDEKKIIYTSHPLHKIPLDVPIYDYLRENINSEMFMIILWSDAYLESPACLNEMGAAWVVQSDYTNMYVPNFSFGNPKYHECAVDTTKMGAVLNGDIHCRMAMIEFKNKIQRLFNLEIEDSKVEFLLEEFINAIK